MNLKKITLFFVSHLAIGLLGFVAGIYALPIIIAPPAPTAQDIQKATIQPQFMARFRRDLKDSDPLHWGEGDVTITHDAITLVGKLAPGPDYQLYLSPEFVETEEHFNQLKSQMVRIGAVKTFDNFVVPLSAGIEPGKFNTVVVWCETFGQFITAAKYR